MTDYFLNDLSGQRSSKIQLSAAIAQGAVGTIYQVIGEPRVVVKLYKKASELRVYKEKIEAMLVARPNLPPIAYKGSEFVQIAWPLATVGDQTCDFVGFIMPKVDFQASTELENVLQKKSRRTKNIPEDYRLRVRLAANLAALIGELHAVGNYMIDMKPMNMRFYPQVQYIAILDTDGFSVGGPRRFPAHQFSDEYISPEARGQSPETLGLEQDLFALATIIFRLLNNGLHPFQGIDAHANHPTSLQERIFEGLYAYGFVQHPTVKPSTQSIHEYLEKETRELFDRAFLSRAGRPTAIEWSTHLKRLITSNILVPCRAHPDHAHFSKGCGFCALDRRNTQNIQLPPTTIGPSQQTPSSVPPLPAAPKRDLSSFLKRAVVAAILLGVAYTKFVPSRTNSVSSTNSISSPAAPTPSTARTATEPEGYHSNFPKRPQPFPEPEPPEEPKPPPAGEPKPRIWASPNVAPQSIALGTGVTTFSWTATPGAQCDPILPRDFHVTRRSRNARSGTFATAGEKTFTIRCSSNDQHMEETVNAIVADPPPLNGVQEQHMDSNWKPEKYDGRIYESYWNMNENMMGLLRNHSRWAFYYITPRPHMAEVNIKPGTLFMTGESEAGVFVGKAFTFSKICGALEYAISGSVNETRVAVVGDAPLVDENCNVARTERRQITVHRQ